MFYFLSYQNFIEIIIKKSLINMNFLIYNFKNANIGVFATCCLNQYIMKSFKSLITNTAFYLISFV